MKEKEANKDSLLTVMLNSVRQMTTDPKNAVISALNILSLLARQDVESKGCHKVTLNFGVCVLLYLLNTMPVYLSNSSCLGLSVSLFA